MSKEMLIRDLAKSLVNVIESKPCVDSAKSLVKRFTESDKNSWHFWLYTICKICDEEGIDVSQDKEVVAKTNVDIFQMWKYLKTNGLI